MIPSEILDHLNSLGLSSKIDINITDFILNISFGFEILSNISELKSFIVRTLNLKNVTKVLDDAEILKMPIHDIIIKDTSVVFIWEDYYPLPARILSSNIFETYCNIPADLFPIKDYSICIDDMFPKQSLSIHHVDAEDFAQINELIFFVVHSKNVISWETFEALILDPAPHINFRGIPDLNIPACRIGIDVDKLLRHKAIDRMLNALFGTTIYILPFSFSTDPHFEEIKELAKKYDFKIKFDFGLFLWLLLQFLISFVVFFYLIRLFS